MKVQVLLVVYTVLSSDKYGTAGWKILHKGKWRSTNNVIRKDVPKDEWFEQKLDHFDVLNTQTWKQRYFTNNTFFKNNGPIFVMIGGEGEAQPIWMVEGMWIEWAKKFNAMCFHLEHRYYGQSHPTKDMSTKNLKFLSSQQALSDLAYFIEAKKKELNLFGNKWIAFGGSYPGSLAAWVRLKYPHLIYGAVASSAPLYAKINFKEYLGVVTEALTTSQHGIQCVESIKEATEELEQAMKNPNCCTDLNDLFHLCDPLEPINELDVANFFENLAGNFEGVVQYNKDNRDFEGVKGTNITIDVVCDIMTNPDHGSPLLRYAAVNSLLLKAVGEKCLDYKYEKYLKDMQSTTWNSSASSGGRQWTYQTCTEFGYYQSSDLNSQPFGKRFPINFSIRQCSDIFGSKFNLDLLKEAVSRTNTIYGGLKLKVSRVLFPNGSIDPWHALGITNNKTGNEAIFIQGTAHCADMYPPSAKDPEDLVIAREKIENHLREWLS